MPQVDTSAREAGTQFLFGGRTVFCSCPGVASACAEGTWCGNHRSERSDLFIPANSCGATFALHGIACTVGLHAPLACIQHRIPACMCFVPNSTTTWEDKSTKAFSNWLEGSLTRSYLNGLRKDLNSRPCRKD